MMYPLKVFSPNFNNSVELNLDDDVA